jgi:hypothetical protein
LLEVHAIAIEIGDSGVRVSTDIDLADAYLKQGDAAAAKPHVNAAAAERPDGAASLKIRARLVALEGNDEEAARLMGLARIAAGEDWTTFDSDLLASYRAEAGDSSK